MRRRAAAGCVGQQGRAGDDRLLRHPHDARARRQRPLAAVRLDLAGQDPQQRRLPRPVAPDQAGAPPRLQRQVHAIEQQDRPVLEPHVLQGEDRRTAHSSSWAALAKSSARR